KPKLLLAGLGVHKRHAAASAGRGCRTHIGRNNMEAIGREPHRADRVPLPLCYANFFPLLQVKEVQKPVARSGQSALAVWGNRDSKSKILRRGKLMHLLTSLDIPVANRAIHASGERALVLLGKSHGQDRSGMTVETANLLAGLRVPQAQRFVLTTGEH